MPAQLRIFASAVLSIVGPATFLGKAITWCRCAERRHGRHGHARASSSLCLVKAVVTTADLASRLASAADAQHERYLPALRQERVRSD